jgi:hypothetical protein
VSRRLPRLLLAAVLALAACGSHVVGELPLCCFDLASEQRIAACPTASGGGSGSCRCLPELCGLGSVCMSDEDCPAPVDLCTKCSDGTIACMIGHCNAGRCQLDTSRCPSAAPDSCRDDFGCSAPQACISCADSTRSCYAARCTDGTCRVLPPACPCRGTSDCYDDGACTLCSDGITQVCLAAMCLQGRCLMVAPAQDSCPRPPPCSDSDGCKPACISCADGSSVCGRAWCADDGRCRVARPGCPSKFL